MNLILERQVADWLRCLRIPIAYDLLRSRLLAHPNYPSLLSITDTLDELEIDNAALVVDKEKISELPIPFLAYLNNRGGQFVVVTNVTDLQKKYPDFYDQWNGIIIAAEKPANWHNDENEIATARRKKKHSLLLRQAAVLTLVIVAGMWFNTSWFTLALTISSLAGLFVAILIVQHELGVTNPITDKLCGASSQTDCNAVMRSRPLKILRWFQWADASIIYFFSISVIFFLQLIAGAGAASLLAVAALISMPITFFSIYYQWKIVGKWCPLCLLIVAILWFQFALQIPLITAFDIRAIAAAEVLTMVLLFTIASAIWLSVLKPALKKNRETEHANFVLKRLKNDPTIITSMLHQQRIIDTTPFVNELQLGNPKANVQIIVACNPYCGPCAKTHALMEALLQKHDIGFSIRFSITDTDKEDKKITTVQYLLRHLHSHENAGIAYKKQVLRDWYEWMDYQRFAGAYYTDESIDVTDQLAMHKQWTEKSGIQFTPTIFINGFELPKQYTTGDLRAIVKGLTAENIETRTEISETSAIPA
ncbi:MAG TPA: thioredoxin domain-containing protein [Chitinophagaceae bacterium]|nr:thioredoxin domain-containing protein [Chitinophagaceae bacterium]